MALGMLAAPTLAQDAPKPIKTERVQGAAPGATTLYRVGELIAGGTALTRVACACQPGTEGTQACNYGRLCGRLTANGRDVGTILIDEGLAHPYVCGASGCPRRPGWC